MNTEQIWTEKVARYLVGRKIVEVKYLPLEETTEWGWYKRPCEIHLDDGTIIHQVQMMRVMMVAL